MKKIIAKNKEGYHQGNLPNKSHRRNSFLSQDFKNQNENSTDKDQRKVVHSKDSKKIIKTLDSIKDFPSENNKKITSNAININIVNTFSNKKTKQK